MHPVVAGTKLVWGGGRKDLGLPGMGSSLGSTTGPLPLDLPEFKVTGLRCIHIQEMRVLVFVLFLTSSVILGRSLIFSGSIKGRNEGT